MGTVDWVIQKNDDCISDGSGHIKCNGYDGLCVDAKLWYVYAVVLARLCVCHGNRNIAHGIQYLCAAYEADGQQGNGRGVADRPSVGWDLYRV